MTDTKEEKPAWDAHILNISQQHLLAKSNARQKEIETRRRNLTTLLHAVHIDAEDGAFNDNSTIWYSPDNVPFLVISPFAYVNSHNLDGFEDFDSCQDFERVTDCTTCQMGELSIGNPPIATNVKVLVTQLGHRSFADVVYKVYEAIAKCRNHTDSIENLESD